MKRLLIIMLVLLHSLTNAQNTSSLELDGANDYAIYDDDATLGKMDGAADYTIEAWVYPTNTVDEYDRILQRFYSFALVMYDGDNNGIVEDWYFYYYDSATSSWKFINTATDVTLVQNMWNHVAVINNSSDNTIKLFVNGVDVTDGTPTAKTLRSSVSNDNLYIGSQKGSSPNKSFDGKIDEVRLKDEAIAPGDLHADISDAPYVSDAATAALFHFDENAGSTSVNEASGSNASLINGATWGTVVNLPFPVKLINFSGIVDQHHINLNWSTASEINNEGFEIQRSSDAHKWQKIGFIKGKSTSNNISKYSFIDNNPAQDNYYRLKQIDYDGLFNYSNVISIRLKTKNDFDVFPNPVHNIINIMAQNSSENSYDTHYSLIDLSGKVLLSGLVLNNKIIFDELPSGVYNLILNTSSQQVVKRIFIQ